MTPFNFHNLLNDINSGWPQYVKAGFLPAIGRYDDNGLEKPYNNPHGYVHLSYINNVNERFKRGVMIRDTSIGGCPDKYTVHIHLSDGMYTSKGEDIRPMVDSYIADRLGELNTVAPHLSKSTGEYPIVWEGDFNGVGASSETFAYIRGTAYIPVQDIESGHLELADVSKLLAGAFNLVEHPNHHDSYLAMNRLGYCNDSWSVPNVE